MKFQVITAAALTSLALAGASEAATIFFSTTNTGPQVPGNPTIVLTPGTPSATVFMWAQLNPDIDGEGTGEKLVGLGLDLVGQAPANSGASAWATALPTRWQVNTAPAYANALFEGLALGAVTTAGLDGSLAPQGGPGQLRVGSFTVSATGAADGVMPAFLRVGTQKVVYAAGQGGPLVNFGTGDQGVTGTTVGAQSAEPDLFIQLNGFGGGEIPEPATLGLAAFGALGLLRRRRA